MEVTEPIAKGAMHLRAASLAFAEADTALTTLLRSSLAETMAAGRQVPLPKHRLGSRHPPERR